MVDLWISCVQAVRTCIAERTLITAPGPSFIAWPNARARPKVRGRATIARNHSKAALRLFLDFDVKVRHAYRFVLHAHVKKSGTITVSMKSQTLATTRIEG
jgi:hypothetical protein